MDFPFAERMQNIISFCALFGLALSLACAAQGQEIRLSQLPAPPPMKFVSPDERAQLSAAHDPKARTRASLELAESRLARAEQLTSGQQYVSAAAELGGYQGLIEDAMRFLNETGTNKGKLRDVYKRLELALRAHAARIEAIRRATPAEHAVNVKAIADYARSARTDALNAFYGDTVVRDNLRENTDSSHSERPKDSSPDPQKKQP